MPRAKKDYKNISLKMDAKIHAMLVAYADDKGQSLTTAVERILKEKLESEGYDDRSSDMRSDGNK